jgi:hypothetical protein
MKEKFEHKLINRIREVFEKRQPDFNPQDWEVMKSRLTNQQVRKIPFLWTFVKAASILLLISSLTYFLWNSLKKNQLPLKENSQISVNAPDQINKIDSSIKSKGNKKNIEVPQIAESSHLPRTKTSTRIQKQQEIISESIMLNTATLEQTLDEKEITDKSTVDMNEEKTPTLVSEDRNKDLSINHIDTIPTDLDLGFAGGRINSQKQRIKFGVELASFTNYSTEDIVPAMNYAGGFVANIPVKSRFSFNPGLIVVAYNVNLNDLSQQYNETGFSTNSVQEIIENDRDLQPTGIILTGIDIPVNFQYRFIQRKKSDYFVELGFSNLFYLSENYSYSFTKLSGPNSYTGTLSEETVTGNISNTAFETFDFAKIFNFSIGWNYKLNNRFDFSLDPYIKYPLGTLGSGDVRFGSGGLKLKLMVRPGKK